MLKVPRVARGERGAPGVGDGGYHRVELFKTAFEGEGLNVSDSTFVSRTII